MTEPADSQERARSIFERLRASSPFQSFGAEEEAIPPIDEAAPSPEDSDTSPEDADASRNEATILTDETATGVPPDSESASPDGAGKSYADEKRDDPRRFYPPPPPPDPFEHFGSSGQTPPPEEPAIPVDPVVAADESVPAHERFPPFGGASGSGFADPREGAISAMYPFAAPSSSTSDAPVETPERPETTPPGDQTHGESTRGDPAGGDRTPHEEFTKTDRGAAETHEGPTNRFAEVPSTEELAESVEDRGEPADEPLVPLDIPDGLDVGPGSAEVDPAEETPSGVSPTDEYGRTRHPGAAQHPLPRILAIANQKGGVGKTTTTVNLSASLAALGYRVLVIDLDPQGNATTGLGINARNLDHSIYDVMLHDTPIEDVIEPTSLRNLFVVPATIDLAGAEIELVPTFSREQRLAKSLETVEPDFDFVLIDCPPSLGLLTINALTAAGEVLVPIQCEYYALEGLSQLLRNVNLVKSNLNADLDLSTIVLTMYDGRTKLADQVATEVRSHFGERVCRTAIPRSVRLSEAPSFGQPVITFDPGNRGAIAYRELAKEVSGGAPQRVR